MKSYLIKLITIFGLLVSCQSKSKDGKFQLDSDGKYQNLLIHIDNVEKDAEKFIDSIKTQMTLASQALHKATSNLGRSKQGVQFGTIYISIPNSWNISSNTVTWQQYNNAHFIITSNRSNKLSSKPYTKQSTKCGVQGEYSKFSESFFRNEKDKLRNGKRIMREFAKLRYGVFSEKPYRNILYVHDGQKIIKGICNQNIEWTVNKSNETCSDKNKNCKYSIKENQSHNYSIMFDYITPSSEFFCNDDTRPHNRFAHNLHNLRCKGKSVSAVILKHSDFKKYKTNDKEFEDPIFQIVKQEGKKIVVVIDRSGSMNKPMKNIKMGLSNYIWKIIEPTTKVGIASFANTANIISPLLSMNNTDNKNNLTKLISNISCFGYSNIIVGIQEGVKILLNNAKQKIRDFETVIVISDSQSFGPDVKDLEKESKKILKTKVPIHFLLVGGSMDKTMKTFIQNTGGIIFNNSQMIPFLQGLNYAVYKSKLCGKNCYKKKKLRKSKGSYSKKTNPLYYFYPHFDGKKTTLTFVFKKDIKKYDVKVISPTGKVLENYSMSQNKKKDKLIFEVSGKIETGMYKLNVTSKKKDNRNKRSYQLNIYGNYGVNDYKIEPIGELSTNQIPLVDSSSYVTVTIDLSDCKVYKFDNITVNLEVRQPDQTILMRKLTDDGLGDDSIENDQIYTKKLYSKDLMIKGFYTFIGHVNLKDKKNSETVKRTVTFENVLVREVSETASEDKVAPARMQEPKITFISSKEKRLSLTTITPGDDSMEGRINKYQILIRSTIDLIKNVTMSTIPYETLCIILDLQQYSYLKVFNIAIRGVDKIGNVGQWSDLVTVNME